ncbi:unnamed protein product [Ceratitis capitata]|uniref:(Mediterranean fruit fly) hypothetical protein n=1 Tax=Ceratitis capitata TaxID=7213 RepID=A0A811VHL8_CERCA|nr:unnamed protein product [Ceratitis capitata]
MHLKCPRVQHVMLSRCYTHSTSSQDIPHKFHWWKKGAKIEYNVGFEYYTIQRTSPTTTTTTTTSAITVIITIIRKYKPAPNHTLTRLQHSMRFAFRWLV